LNAVGSTRLLDGWLSKVLAQLICEMKPLAVDVETGKLLMEVLLGDHLSRSGFLLRTRSSAQRFAAELPAQDVARRPSRLMPVGSITLLGPRPSLSE
jgi:hypothetical protein